MIGRLVWYGDFPLERRLELLKAAGYDYIEISLDYPFPEEVDVNELKELLESFEMSVAFHSPLDVFIAQPRDEVFEASMKIIERCLNFVSNFETAYYNFHITYFCPTREFERVRKKVLENGRKACEFIVERAESSGFDVALEYDRNFDESFLVENLKICLDIGHFALANKKNYLSELENFVKKFERRILVAHIHDCNLEKRIDHISLNNGELDLRKILAKVKANFYTIETFWRDSDRNELRDVDVISDYEILKSLLEK